MLLTKAVIGSTVEAAYFALVNDFFFIPTRKTPPMFYNEAPIPSLKTRTEPESWNKVNTMLGLSSKRICFPETSALKIEEGIVKIVSENTVFRYQFDKIYVFDTTSIKIDNKIKKALPKTFIVIDDFELSTMGQKRYHLPTTTRQENFAKKINFYCSGRVDGSDYITDCVVESEMTQEQINLFEYSDSMVRFVVQRHLEAIGVRGSLMKYYNNGMPKYRKPKVKHVKRIVQEKDNNIYEDTDIVKILNLSLGDIIENCTQR